MENKKINHMGFSEKIRLIKEQIDNEERTLHIKLHQITKPYKMSSYIEYSNGLKYSFFNNRSTLTYLTKEKTFNYLLNELEKYVINFINDTNTDENLYSINWKYNDSEEVYTTNIYAKHMIVLIEKFHYRDFERPRDILNIAKLD